MTEFASLSARTGGERDARVSVLGSPGGPHRKGIRLAELAGVVGVTFGAVSVCWGLGGTWMLNTVSGSLAEKSAAGQANLLVGAWMPAVLKLVAAVLPLLAIRWRASCRPTRSVWDGPCGSWPGNVRWAMSARNSWSSSGGIDNRRYLA